MPDNVLIATANDANGAHQKVVNEYLDAGGLPVPVTAATPLPVLASISTAGLATSTGQTTGNNTLASIDSKTAALGQQLAAASTPVVLTAAQLATLTPPAQITGFALAANQQTNAITDAQIRATALPVSGAFFQATQPVSGTVSTGLSQPLTDTQLRLTPVPVSGTVVTGGLTDTQIRATPLPISGTVSTGLSQPLTDTQIRATALPVSGTFFQATQPVSLLSDADNTATGSLTAAAQTVVLPMAAKSAAAVVITGTWAGTITFEGTVDGTNWASINAVAASTSQPQATTTVNGLYRLTPAGLLQIRAIMSAFTSGTATLSMRASLGVGGIFANQILPTKITDGTNTATIKPASTASAATDLPLVVALHPSSATPNFAAAQAVTGTFFQATQPVSLATNTPTIQAGTALIGKVGIDQTTPGTTNLVALAANQSVNVAQINGITPLMGNGVTGTGSQRVTLASDGTAISTAGFMSVKIDQTTPGTTNAVTDTKLPASAAAADALANPTITQIGVENMLFNGTSWDRQRGMSVATTTGDTGAKTATGNGATQTNVGNKGVQVFIVLGTVSGTTPTAVFKIQGSVDGGTTFYDIPGATTASLTASTNVGIMLFPGVTVTAGSTITGTTAGVSAILPRTWRMVWTIGGTTPSFTITSITYNYIPY